RTARLRKRTYCTHSGSSRPSSARSCRTSSSRASSGRSSRVGSPVRWRRAKTMTDTPSRTPRLCTRRRATKPKISKRGGPRHGPPNSSTERGNGPLGLPRPALVAPRQSRGAPRSSETDFGQAYRLVAAGRPLEPGADAIDVHLLVAEDVWRIVADQPEELAIELLALVLVHLGASRQDQLVHLGVRVLRDRLAGGEGRRHPVVGLEARQGPARHWGVFGRWVEGGGPVRAPLADDLHVGLDAVLIELASHRLRDVLVHRPAAVRRLDGQREVRLPGGRQELLRLLGVVLVDRDARVVSPHVGRHP